MQTILGAGGPIGNELVKELIRKGKRVRLVGRDPTLVAGATEAVAANLADLDQIVHVRKS